MRATVHAVDAADFVAFRPLFGSLMAGLRANYGRNLQASTRTRWPRRRANCCPRRTHPRPRDFCAYDNLLLSHADRRRVPGLPPGPAAPGNGATEGSLLVDGHWDATWKITREALTISPFRRLTAAEQSAITEEAAALLTFTTPAAPARGIRFTTPA